MSWRVISKFRSGNTVWFPSEKRVKPYERGQIACFKKLLFFRRQASKMSKTRLYYRSSDDYSTQKLFDSMVISGEELYIQALLKKGVDIDAWYKGNTPLLYACSLGSERIVGMLIKNGANVDCCDDKKRTALHYASEYGWKEVVWSLVKKVSNINSRDIFGETPLHRASREQDLEIVRCLVEVGADTNLQNSDGFTPLICAAKFSNKDIFDLLLISGAEVDGIEGWILYYDSQNNWTEVVQSVVKGVPDWNQRIGKTNLDATSSRGFLEVVKFLLGEGTDINGKNKIIVVALLEALYAGYVEAAKWLVTRVHDLNAGDFEGMTALHAASYIGNLEMVKFLLEQGADVNTRDKNGNGALHIAPLHGSLELMKYLVEQGADISMKGFSGTTPMLCAANCKNKDAVELLLNLGASVDGLISNRFTMLHLASECGWTDVVECLVKRGCDLEATSMYNHTALYYACQNKRLDTVGYLLQAGARWDIVDMDDMSPLNYVTMEQMPDIKYFELFIENGAYLNHLDYYGLVESSSLQVLQDVKLSSQSIINKFNNHSLPELYKSPLSGSLPSIENMKIKSGSKVAQSIERTVELQIQTEGHCHILEVRPMALSVFSIASIVDYYKKKTELKNQLKRPAAVDPVHDYECKSRRLS